MGFQSFKKLFFLMFATAVLQYGIVQAQGSTTPRPKELSIERSPVVPPKATTSIFSSGTKVFPQTPEQFSEDQAGATPDNYLVGPGDTFVLSFWGRIDDVISIRVDDQYKVFIPRLGAMDVRGLTFKEFKAKLESKIKSSLINVSFLVSMQAPRKFSVYVLGSVKTPGPVTATGLLRVSDLIALAGGVEPRGSKQFIELRRNNEVLHVNLLSFYAFGDFSRNPLVTDGDVVFVPLISDFVTVSGAIAEPGVFEIKETKSLADVVKSLGGPMHYADRTQPIRISRALPTGRQNLTASWASLSSLDGAERDSVPFELTKGDEVFIPSAPILIPSQSDSVFVTGEVRAPGAKPYRNSMTVDEYIGSAGGVSNRANMKDARVFKKDGTSVALTQRMVIEPGDTIFIPEKTFKFWEDHVMILTTFLTLATTIITVSK